jgi:hypothetical protein
VAYAWQQGALVASQVHIRVGSVDLLVLRLAACVGDTFYWYLV